MTRKGFFILFLMPPLAQAVSVTVLVHDIVNRDYCYSNVYQNPGGIQHCSGDRGTLVSGCTIPIASGDQLTWGGVTLGTTGWKNSNQILKISIDKQSSSVNNFGVQAYTNNTSAAADPRYTGPVSGANPTDPSGLVGKDYTGAGDPGPDPNASNQRLPLIWTVKDIWMTPMDLSRGCYPGGIVGGGGAYICGLDGYTENLNTLFSPAPILTPGGPGNAMWIFLKDLATPAIGTTIFPYNPGGEYESVWRFGSGLHKYGGDIAAHHYAPCWDVDDCDGYSYFSYNYSKSNPSCGSPLNPSGYCSSNSYCYSTIGWIPNTVSFYMYLAADFTNARTPRTYQTSTLTLEFYTY